MTREPYMTGPKGWVTIRETGAGERTSHDA